MTRRGRIRFHPRIYAEIVRRQDGICACGCGEALGTDPREIEYDHEIPLSLDGEDTPENLRALKRRHHLVKTIGETKARAKVARIQSREGLMKRRLNRHDRALAAILEATKG